MARGRAGQGNVREETQEMFRGMFEAAMKVIHDQGGNGGQTAPRVGLEQFLKLKPIGYDGEPDVEKAEKWVEAMEKIFDVLACTEGDRVRFAAYKFSGAAEHWWKTVKASWDEAQVPYTWENFVRKFKEHFIPAVDQDKKEIEFLSLEQNFLSVAQYVAKFTALSRYCTHLVATEERKSTRFVRGLKSVIRTQLVAHKFRDFQDAVDRAYHVEHDLEEQKRKTERSSMGNRGGQGKIQQGRDDRGVQGVTPQFQGPPLGQSSVQRQGYIPGILNNKVCGYCKKGGHSTDQCRLRQGKCLNCGQLGHFRRDCPMLKEQSFGNVTGASQGQKRDASGRPKV